MLKFYRVKDNITGHEFTTANIHDGLTVLDKPAFRDGRPARAKPNTSAARRKKETPSAATEADDKET